MNGKYSLSQSAFSILAVLVLFTSVLQAGSIPVRADALSNTQSQDNSVRRAYHSATGKLSFLGAPQGKPISIREALAPGLAPQDRVLAMIAPYAIEFCLKDVHQELTLKSTSPSPDDRLPVTSKPIRAFPSWQVNWW